MTFVEQAMQFEASVTVRRTDQDEPVDGKSIMQMLMLAGTCGTEIEVVCEGSDEAAAAKALEALVASGFDDEEQ